MKPRRDLTPAERDAADNLKRIWEEKRQRLDLTQERAAERLGWTTQGAVSHYLNGRNPLNADAILRFASLLDVDPREIDPAIAELLPRAESLSADECRILAIFRRLDQEGKKTIIAVAEMAARGSAATAPTEGELVLPARDAQVGVDRPGGARQKQGGKG